MQIHLRYILPLVLFLYFTHATHAQKFEPIYHHYTVKEGLPSSEIYELMQDHQGYLWMATDRGITKFDGYTFKTFTSKDGLPDNTFFKIYEDDQHRIWVLAMNHKIGYFIKDKYYPYKFNDQIKTTLQKGNFFLTAIHIDKNENIYLSAINYGLFKIDNKGQVSTINHSFALNKVGAYFGVKEIKGQFFPYIKKHIMNGSSDHNFISLETKKINFVQHVDRAGSNFVSMVKRKNGDLVASSREYIFGITNGKTWASPFSFIVNSMYEDYDSSLWLGTNKGILYYPKGADIRKDSGEVYFSNFNVSDILQDKEGGIWVSTIGDGVIYIPNHKMKQIIFPENAREISDVHSAAGKMWFSQPNGVLFTLNNRLQKNILLQKKLNQSDKLYSAYYHTATNTTILSSLYSTTFYNGTRTYADSNGVISDYVELGDSLLLMAAANNVTMVNLNTGKCTPVYYKAISNRLKIWCMVNYKNQILLGAGNGMHIYKNDKIIPYPDTFFNSRINALAVLNKDTLLIGALGKGLIVYDGKNKTVISKEDGLISEMINHIYIDKNKFIWISTNSGISRLKINKGKYDFFNLDLAHGLPTSEIHKILELNDTLWMQTPTSIFVFNRHLIKPNQLKPYIHFNFFVANDDTLKGDLMKLNYTQSRINISFTGINFRKKGNVLYRYRLLDSGTAWQETYNTEVQYNALSPGEYVFEVQAQNEDGVWSKPIQKKFAILPPFWLTWWFITLCALMLVLIVWLIMRRRIQQTRKQKDVEYEILQLRQQALASQINPHFLFNTLNNIQAFVLIENKKFASEYLSKFARLMRKSLEFSRSEMVSLNDEIELARIFLELEQYRHRTKFEFFIEVDPNIDIHSTFIPAMLIQPYIENSVMHGITPRNDDKGQIHIRIRRQSSSVISCEIEDNGIGRMAAAKIPKKIKSHQSLGAIITLDRIKLMSEKLKQQFSFEIIDLNDPPGTVVKFNIPNKTNNEN